MYQARLRLRKGRLAACANCCGLRELLRESAAKDGFAIAAAVPPVAARNLDLPEGALANLHLPRRRSDAIAAFGERNRAPRDDCGRMKAMLERPIGDAQDSCNGECAIDRRA
jgi:hypothetical protein